MGFLKFLKRDKKQDFGSLDLPPAPPKLEGFDDNLPDFPELPDMTAPDSGKDFKFDFSEDKTADFGKDFGFDIPKEEKMPEIPQLSAGQDASEAKPAFEQKPVAPMPSFAALPDSLRPEDGQEESNQFESSPEQLYEKPRRLFHHEKRPAERRIPKEVYVRVERFKTILDGIGMIRNSVRKSDEALLKLEGIKNAKDRSFDKIKSSIEDLQKKLIFIDKILFKGE